MLRNKVRGDLRLSPGFACVDKTSKVLVIKRGFKSIKDQCPYFENKLIPPHFSKHLQKLPS